MDIIRMKSKLFCILNLNFNEIIINGYFLIIKFF